MKKFLIFSSDSRLFQNTAYRPLNDLDFFQWRQADYIICLYGLPHQIEAKAKKLRLNLNIFYWLRENQETSMALSETVQHIQKIAKIEERDYDPKNLTLLSSSVEDYVAAKSLGINFVAICLDQDEANKFRQAGLDESAIVIKNPEYPGIRQDLRPYL